MRIENMNTEQLKACFSLLVGIIDKAADNSKHTDLCFYLIDLERKLLEKLSERESYVLSTKYMEEDLKHVNQN